MYAPTKEVRLCWFAGHWRLSKLTSKIEEKEVVDIFVILGHSVKGANVWCRGLIKNGHFTHFDD
jgi:hypothetical protein